MRLCAFLLVEAIVFINFIVFKDQLTAVNEYLYTPCMCRSSILKWQYFRNLIIILFLNEYKILMRIVLFQIFKRKMSEAAIRRCSPEIDAPPTPFWILRIN